MTIGVPCQIEKHARHSKTHVSNHLDRKKKEGEGRESVCMSLCLEIKKTVSPFHFRNKKKRGHGEWRECASVFRNKKQVFSFYVRNQRERCHWEGREIACACDCVCLEIRNVFSF